LDKKASVVGLLFGLHSPGPLLHVSDADDIPVEVSDASTLQVNLHKAVFPQHTVVGWYRVSTENDEPTAEDLNITRTLQAYYASTDSFCFCLLHVQKKVDHDDFSMTGDDSAMSAFNEDLPINLYELHQVDDNVVLLGLSNWELETSEPERIAVERVMKERPAEVDDGSPSQNPFVLETKAIQHSLASMKDRVQVLASSLEAMQEGKIPFDPVLLRRIQALVCSLGPLSEKANSGGDEDVQILAHLAIVAKTVNSMQTYTDKFRVMHENRTITKEMRRGF
jgi:hypothetical protein